MGEMYARAHGMTVLCARLGWVVRSPDEIQALVQNAWHSGVLLTHDDASRYLVGCCENTLQFRTSHPFAAMSVTSKPMEDSATNLSEARMVTG